MKKLEAARDALEDYYGAVVPYVKAPRRSRLSTIDSALGSLIEVLKAGKLEILEKRRKRLWSVWQR